MTFASEWAGKFALPPHDPNDPRLNHLLDKYLKNSWYSTIGQVQEAMKAAKVPRTASFSVVPRYTCGSPGSVDFYLAMQVLGEELRSYEHAREGAYGEKKQAEAESKGMMWVAYAVWERGSKVFRMDFATGEVVQNLSDKEIDRRNFLRKHKEAGIINQSQEDELRVLEFRTSPRE